MISETLERFHTMLKEEEPAGPIRGLVGGSTPSAREGSGPSTCRRGKGNALKLMGEYGRAP